MIDALHGKANCRSSQVADRERSKIQQAIRPLGEAGQLAWKLVDRLSKGLLAG
jgi:hypothetical protein